MSLSYSLTIQSQAVTSNMTDKCTLADFCYMTAKPQQKPWKMPLWNLVPASTLVQKLEKARI